MQLTSPRRAPLTFVTQPAECEPAVRGLWRNLEMLWVPTGFGPRRDLVNVKLSSSNTATTYAFQGQANGPAKAAGTFCDNSNTGECPNSGAFSVFAFVVQRDSSNTQQLLCGNGAPSQGGWGFKLNHNAGQIGIVRYGVADERTTGLGRVPTGQASSLGFSHTSASNRFFLNGMFENVASGNPNALTNVGTSSGWCIGVSRSSTEPILDCPIHILYVWSREVSDAEMLLLSRDPWRLVRPAQRWAVQATAASASLARSFVAGFVG